jgi:hypothetical protein
MFENEHEKFKQELIDKLGQLQGFAFINGHHVLERRDWLVYAPSS